MNRRIAAFVRLSRLKFLVGGFAGGALGTAVALFEGHPISLGLYGLAQLTITAAHLMTHYANDYFDRESDARTTRTPYSGGSGALVDGSLDPKIALVAAVACLAVSATGDTALLLRGHQLAAAIGLLVAGLAWAYSAPPVRLLARGFGEADTALVVAMLVPLCAYAAQTGSLDLRAFASTLPGAAAMLVMMVCVQVPDLAADAATGKRNLVVRFGATRAARFAAGGLVAVVAAVALAVACGAPAAFAAWQLAALVPAGMLLPLLVALGRSQSALPSALAARGVAVFATVTLAGVAGYSFAAFVRP